MLSWRFGGVKGDRAFSGIFMSDEALDEAHRLRTVADSTKIGTEAFYEAHEACSDYIMGEAIYGGLPQLPDAYVYSVVVCSGEIYTSREAYDNLKIGL